MLWILTRHGNAAVKRIWAAYTSVPVYEGIVPSAIPIPPGARLPGSENHAHTGRVTFAYVIAPCQASPGKSLAASLVDSPSRIVSVFVSTIVRRIVRRTSWLRSRSR